MSCYLRFINFLQKFSLAPPPPSPPSSQWLFSPAFFFKRPFRFSANSNSFFFPVLLFEFDYEEEGWGWGVRDEEAGSKRKALGKKKNQKGGRNGSGEGSRRGFIFIYSASKEFISRFKLY